MGRKGYLLLNVIGDIDRLPAVKKGIPAILSSVDFTSCNRYRNFNPSVDKMATYGVGGLIAGKVLAKVGFFALILKFWKIMAGVVMAAFYYIKKILTGKKKEQEQEQMQPLSEPEQITMV